MTDEHAKALNSVLSVGGLRTELAAIVRYAGQCAEEDEQARWAVYEKYHFKRSSVMACSSFDGRRLSVLE